jgi:hypothetical protein
MHILPAFDSQQDIIGLGAAVKDGKVIKRRRVLDFYLRVVKRQVVLMKSFTPESPFCTIIKLYP